MPHDYIRYHDKNLHTVKVNWIGCTKCICTDVQKFNSSLCGGHEIMAIRCLHKNMVSSNAFRLFVLQATIAAVESDISWIHDMSRKQWRFPPRPIPNPVHIPSWVQNQEFSGHVVRGNYTVQKGSSSSLSNHCTGWTMSGYQPLAAVIESVQEVQQQERTGKLDDWIWSM